jgi:hypothetical protein
MPPLARAYVKASFVYFIVAFVLGALMVLDGWLSLGRWLRAVDVSQMHLLVVGWITQLAIGVAYWMFPRFLKEQNPLPRGSDRLGWAVFACLNVGLVLRLAVEPLAAMRADPWLKGLLALSGILQAVAALGFGWLVWGRIRAMEP